MYLPPKFCTIIYTFSLVLLLLQENSCISIGELLYTTEQVGILLSTTLESSANQTVRDTLTGRENNIG